MFKTRAFLPENGFLRVSADTKTWAAALLVRGSANLPFLWLYVLYQTFLECSMEIEQEK